MVAMSRRAGRLTMTSCLPEKAHPLFLAELLQADRTRRDLIQPEDENDGRRDEH